MTELKSFLVAVYDALSEAEMAAVTHGQARRAELQREGTLPPDLPVPVYHAADVEVGLDVRLVAEETETGTEIHLVESSPEEGSSFTFTVELFELLEEGDVAEIDYDDVLETLPTRPAESSGGDETARDDDTDTEDDGDSDTDDGDSDTDDGSSGTSVGRPSVDTDPGPAEFADEMTSSPTGRPTATAPDEAGGDDVETVEGIGPRLGSRLREGGIETVADLADASAAELAGRVSTDDHAVSTERAGQWIERAERRLRSADGTENRE